ncbi:MAG: UDP-N-acetylmuramoyl-tripeptide--D-alanyl-D-alanine ligase [Bacteroidetes bacterium]|nr:UDP-N-acetylmuramoyl-tripeptide--D-alanyl-D-alanine ligase [Bacteroidota bacterium]
MKSIDIKILYQLYLECKQVVCTDTRKIIKDSLFIALQGANYDANAFANEALNKGAKYALVSDASISNNNSIFYTNDTLTALQELAAHHRQQFNIPLLAITGSNAKTTHKELTGAVISKKYNTLITEGNLNNHIGVPLTLLKLNEQHQFAIIEMGANHQGEINKLCEIAAPNFGLITNIGKAHLEGFGGFEGVKKGKSEMYKYLQKHGGKVFVNGDDKVLVELSQPNKTITYGTQNYNSVIGINTTQDEFVRFNFSINSKNPDWSDSENIQTKLVGQYNFINCLAAACIGNWFGITKTQIKEALENYEPNMNRSQLYKTKTNTLILDAYNANPDSMKLAIENFAALQHNNKWLFLGAMFELGEYSKQEHEKLISLLNSLKINNAILVGNEFCNIEHSNYKVINTTTECINFIQNQKINDAMILIKGSRGMKMESLIDYL